jgi:hypothetical protein
MAMVLKTIVAATSPWVRIPRPPLLTTKNRSDLRLCPLGPHPGPVADRSQMQPTAAICRWSRDIRVMDLEAFAQVNPQKTEGTRRKRVPCMVDRSGSQCFIDPPVRGLLATIDALRIHPQQHLHAVTCTISHLCGRDPTMPASPSPGTPATRPDTVKARLTPNRSRRQIENDEYSAFVRRILRAYARRVGDGDVEALALMLRRGQTYTREIARDAGDVRRTAHYPARAGQEPTATISQCRAACAEAQGLSREHPTAGRRLAARELPGPRRPRSGASPFAG